MWTDDGGCSRRVRRTTNGDTDDERGHAASSRIDHRASVVTEKAARRSVTHKETTRDAGCCRRSLLGGRKPDGAILVGGCGPTMDGVQGECAVSAGYDARDAEPSSRAWPGRKPPPRRVRSWETFRGRPATRWNRRPKLPANSSQSSSAILSRSRIGATCSGIAPRLPQTSCRPVQSSSSR